MKCLLVFCPTQAACQLQIAGDGIIGLTKARIGIQLIRILAQKIIVAFIVEAGDRIRINIHAVLIRLPAAAYRICILKSGGSSMTKQTIGVAARGVAWKAIVITVTSVHREHCKRIDEDVVILFRLVVQIISADAEIDRTAEI